MSWHSMTCVPHAVCRWLAKCASLPVEETTPATPTGVHIDVQIACGRGAQAGGQADMC